MTRQEAIWHAKHVFNIVIERCINAQNLKDAREFDEAKQIVIEALEREPKWIPVTERLPEKGEIVLITNTMWNVRSIGIDWWNGEQWVRNGQYVIAWQPLPEPYKESDGE